MSPHLRRQFLGEDVHDWSGVMSVTGYTKAGVADVATTARMVDTESSAR